ncbi:response regulator transcription factor [Umezawaea sp.]|uniref:helix-turn-helix transcriptional regulator n=1 Tax=Umezawaea sp. TaxID=1955258 RepID=UPI002ED5A1BD
MVVHKIAVVVHGGDPLSRAGLAGFLEQQRSLVVLDEDVAVADRANGVAVVLDDRVDPVGVVRLRKLVLSTNQKVVLVTGELSELQVEMVLDAGVQCVVWRHQATGERLVRAVETAARGEGDVPSDLLARLLAQLRGAHRRTGTSLPPAAEPTPRELGVLRLVAEGLDTKEIADQLAYSERTVKGVLHDVMVRRRLRNRAHAVAFAVREGYI